MKANDAIKKAAAQVIFVLGGPGAGKGTQCANIVRDYGFVHLSAGELLRREMKTEGSPNGELIRGVMKDGGKIVPVEITVGLLKREMETNIKNGKRKFLVDGYPRNQDNVDGWNSVIGDFASIPFVLFFNCPEDVMEKRLLARGESSGRTDDNPEAIRKRFNIYQKISMPIVDFYRARGMVRQVDCAESVDEVYRKVRVFMDDVR
eukprot:632129_1